MQQNFKILGTGLILIPLYLENSKRHTKPSILYKGNCISNKKGEKSYKLVKNKCSMPKTHFLHFGATNLEIDNATISKINHNLYSVRRIPLLKRWKDQSFRTKVIAETTVATDNRPVT